MAVYFFDVNRLFFIFILKVLVIFNLLLDFHDKTITAQLMAFFFGFENEIKQFRNKLDPAHAIYSLTVILTFLPLPALVFNNSKFN